MPRKPSPKRFRNAGVRLEEPVIVYLDRMAVEEDRHRSWVINRIVREYAEQRGTPIPGSETPPRPAHSGKTTDVGSSGRGNPGRAGA